MSERLLYDRTGTIEAFLAATAARQPTPGGGSVAAMAGALAAAIGEMTLNYSIGRKNGADADAKLTPIVTELQRARELLLQLLVEDQAAYDALTAIHKMPAESSERAERMPAAVLTCIRVPQAIGGTGLAILELCDRVVDLVNPRLLSDWAVCAELAMATVRCGTYNCRVNLVDVKNAADRRAVEESTAHMLARALAFIQRVVPRIWKRHEELLKG